MTDQSKPRPDLKLLHESLLAKAIGRMGVGGGRRVLDYMADRLRNYPQHPIRIEPADAQFVLDEFNALIDMSARLGEEARYSRNNVQLARDAKPYPIQICMNCRFFDAVKSTDAHIEVERQAIVEETGACQFAPPVARPSGSAGGPPNTSYFPPVHPARWCGQWARLDNRKVPRE